jgi:hypothetical protein
MMCWLRWWVVCILQCGHMTVGIKRKQARCGTDLYTSSRWYKLWLRHFRWVLLASVKLLKVTLNWAIWFVLTQQAGVRPLIPNPLGSSALLFKWRSKVCSYATQASVALRHLHTTLWYTRTASSNLNQHWHQRPNSRPSYTPLSFFWVNYFTCWKLSYGLSRLMHSLHHALASRFVLSPSSHSQCAQLECTDDNSNHLRLRRFHQPDPGLVWILSCATVEIRH